MNDKNFALKLMTLAASMLLEKPVTKATVVVEDSNQTHPFGCTCPKCAPRKATPKPCAPRHDFNREPDGVQINVDRPRVENYISRHDFAVDMANYRTLIEQAKKCEWKSRVPENIPPHVHANRRDWYEDNEPRIAPNFRGGWDW